MTLTEDYVSYLNKIKNKIALFRKYIFWYYKIKLNTYDVLILNSKKYKKHHKIKHNTVCYT